jgi:hypothetical protein
MEVCMFERDWHSLTDSTSNTHLAVRLKWSDFDFILSISTHFRKDSVVDLLA